MPAEVKKPFSQALYPAYESSFWKVSFSMNETVTKRFLLYFRLMMVAIGALTPESELLVFSSFFSQRPGSKDAGALHFYVDSAVFPCYNGVK